MGHCRRFTSIVARSSPLFPAPSRSGPSPERHRPPPTTMHLLKNGRPAHVFTLEDRRKAAHVATLFLAAKRAAMPYLPEIHSDVETRRSMERGVLADHEVWVG